MTARARLLIPILLVAASALAGCADKLAEVGKEPSLTPVGAGLKPNRVSALSDVPPPIPQKRGNSLWTDAGTDLFRDPRATRVGDVVTVKISIKDKASLDNSTQRSRDSKNNLDLENGYEFSYGNGNFAGTGNGKLTSDMSSGTSTKGQGAISRSESIELLVAAIVSDVLPNGNLVVSGSQEVRVNQELRVLNVAGVLRPRDIATDNTVSYDKIAEARISYGGRGRVTEIQNPGWGQQLVDLFAPF
ncbi:MAG: flagellar basal body L-ring protein FlgH [Hyphomicrobiaceae bacterium]|nr:flagellar basal body L-ring protein FlgH [Hyphomicrobiaceae bacterium]